jgi:hypothetical protein
MPKGDSAGPGKTTKNLAMSESSKLPMSFCAPQPAKDMGHGTFVIGDTLVRPLVAIATSKTALFKRGEKVNV